MNAELISVLEEIKRNSLIEIWVYSLLLFSCVVTLIYATIQIRAIDKFTDKYLK